MYLKIYINLYKGGRSCYGFFCKTEAVNWFYITKLQTTQDWLFLSVNIWSFLLGKQEWPTKQNLTRNIINLSRDRLLAGDIKEKRYQKWKCDSSFPLPWLILSLQNLFLWQGCERSWTHDDFSDWHTLLLIAGIR